jgi:hypothetical protein
LAHPEKIRPPEVVILLLRSPQGMNMQDKNIAYQHDLQHFQTILVGAAH